MANNIIEVSPARPLPSDAAAQANVASDASAPVSPEQAASLDVGRRQVIMAMLFADIVGYSKVPILLLWPLQLLFADRSTLFSNACVCVVSAQLEEAQVLAFVENFLGAVSFLLDSLPKSQQPKVRNTWGDAVSAACVPACVLVLFPCEPVVLVSLCSVLLRVSARGRRRRVCTHAIGCGDVCAVGGDGTSHGAQHPCVLARCPRACRDGSRCDTSACFPALNCIDE